MSAGPTLAQETAAQVCNDLATLAPAMQLAVQNALNECHALGLDPVVHESFRSQALQETYYAKGRRKLDDGTWEVVDKDAIVTNVRDARWGWHFYGLAVDVISARWEWNVTAAWRQAVTDIFKKHGLDWGGDWVSWKDLPHYQWGTLKPTPSDRARELLAEGGREAVWREVGALTPSTPEPTET